MGLTILSAVLGLVGALVGAGIGFGIDRVRGRDAPGLSMLGVVMAIGLGFGAALTATLTLAGPARLISTLTQEEIADNERILSLMQKYYPAQAGWAMARARAAKGGDEALNLDLALPDALDQVFLENGRYLDQANAAALVGLMAEEFGLLAETNPLVCGRSLRGQIVGSRDARVLPTSLRRRSADGLEKALLQMATHPAPPVSPLSLDDYRYLAAKSMRGMTGDREENMRLLSVLVDPDPPTDPAQARRLCVFVTRVLYQAEFERPVTLRRMMAGPPG